MENKTNRRKMSREEMEMISKRKKMSKEEIIELSKKLTSDIFRELRARAKSTGETVEWMQARLERAKLEDHDGEMKLTRFTDIAKYSRSIWDYNVTLWYNYSYSRKRIREDIEAALMKDYLQK